MIADTLVVVLICLSPAQPVQPDTAISISGNRFSEVFKEADRDFERKYHLSEKIREASKQAVKSADKKTRNERNKVIRSTQWIKGVLIELQNNLTYEYP